MDISNRGHFWLKPSGHETQVACQTPAGFLRVLAAFRPRRHMTRDGDGAATPPRGTEGRRGGTAHKKMQGSARAQTLADARAQLISIVGYRFRKMWRRKDLEEVGNIIVDLLCEALQRTGHSYRPKEGEPAQLYPYPY